MREISLKENQVNLMIGEMQFDDISDINHYEEFFDDKDFQEDLIDFLSAYNRTNLINSPIYQKQKALNYFKEFILFQKIISNYKADASKTKQNDSELKSFLIIHPEKNQILNLSEERTSDKEPKSEELISLNHQNS